MFIIPNNYTTNSYSYLYKLYASELMEKISQTYNFGNIYYYPIIIQIPN